MYFSDGKAIITIAVDIITWLINLHLHFQGLFFAENSHYFALIDSDAVSYKTSVYYDTIFWGSNWQWAKFGWGNGLVLSRLQAWNKLNQWWPSLLTRICVTAHTIFKFADYIWGHWGHKEVFRARISNYIPQNVVWCDKLSMSRYLLLASKASYM